MTIIASGETGSMPNGVTSRMLPVRDGEIHLLEGGKGPPLLVLHAAGGAGIWQPAHERLAQHFRVFAPDHPGFGQSPVIDCIDAVSDLAFHYVDVLDRLELDKVHVVGSSFGGWVAAELAVLAPERVAQLVLVDPIGLRVAGHPVGDLFAMGPQEKMANLFYDQAIPARMFPSEPDIGFILRMYRDEAAFARYAWSPFCANPKLPRRLFRISAPTLILWGEHDRVVPVAHGERYAELISHATLEVIPQAAHAVMMERPDVVTDRICAFAGVA